MQTRELLHQLTSTGVDHRRQHQLHLDDQVAARSTARWHPPFTQAEPLSGGQLVTSLRSVLSGQTESINVLPAFIVAGPQFAKAEKSIQADYQRNELLAQKFDPEKIKLGDAEGRLVLDYGLPLIISTNQQNGIRLYCFGSDEPLRVNPAYRFSNLAVIVANGFVARIFSHDFYDREGNYTISEPQAEPKGNK